MRTVNFLQLTKLTNQIFKFHGTEPANIKYQ